MSANKCFTRTLKCFALATAIAMCMPPGAKAAGGDNGTAVDAAIQHSLDLLARYRTTNSLSDLRSSIYQMQGATNIDALTPKNFVQERRNIVQGWAKILRAIEREYDPTFDVQKRLGCPIPAGSATKCADPSVIKDLKEREKYASELRAFYDYNRRASHYVDITVLDNLAMSSLESSLKLINSVAPEGVSLDSAAIDAILQNEGLSDVRRKKIDAMIYERM